MKYSVEPVSYNGVIFKLERGTITQLYDCVEGALKKFCGSPNLNLIPPARPKFEDLPTGQSELESFKLKVEEDGRLIDQGQINMTYLRRKGINPRKDVDYPASSTFAYKEGKTRYEALTILFNTTFPNMPEDAIDYVRECERDFFLERLEDLVEDCCKEFEIVNKR